jgi:hypothetical protein
MKLRHLIEESTRTEIKQRVKINKRALDDELEMGDNIPVDHEAVTAVISTSDEFDIPPTWLVKVTVDLTEI